MHGRARMLACVVERRPAVGREHRHRSLQRQREQRAHRAGQGQHGPGPPRRPRRQRDAAQHTQRRQEDQHVVGLLGDEEQRPQRHRQQRHQQQHAQGPAQQEGVAVAPAHVAAVFAASAALPEQGQQAGRSQVPQQGGVVDLAEQEDEVVRRVAADLAGRCAGFEVAALLAIAHDLEHVPEAPREHQVEQAVQGQRQQQAGQHPQPARIEAPHQQRVGQQHAEDEQRHGLDPEAEPGADAGEEEARRPAPLLGFVEQHEGCGDRQSQRGVGHQAAGEVHVRGQRGQQQTGAQGRTRAGHAPGQPGHEQHLGHRAQQRVGRGAELVAPEHRGQRRHRKVHAQTVGPDVVAHRPVAVEDAEGVGGVGDLVGAEEAAVAQPAQQHRGQRHRHQHAPRARRRPGGDRRAHHSVVSTAWMISAWWSSMPTHIGRRSRRSAMSSVTCISPWVRPYFRPAGALCSGT